MIELRGKLKELLINQVPQRPEYYCFNYDKKSNSIISRYYTKEEMINMISDARRNGKPFDITHAIQNGYVYQILRVYTWDEINNMSLNDIEVILEENYIVEDKYKFIPNPQHVWRI